MDSIANGLNPSQVCILSAYVIADIKVTNDKWVPADAASVHNLVHKHGGTYLSRRDYVKTLEGEPPDTTPIALIVFPSAEAALAFRPARHDCLSAKKR